MSSVNAAPSSSSTGAVTTNWGLATSETPPSAVAVAPSTGAGATTTTAPPAKSPTVGIEGQMANLEVKGDSKDEDDSAPVKTFSGLHPNDKKATIEFAGETKTYAGVYRAASTFAELNLRKELMDGIIAMGFSTPSKIQAEALPIILGKEKPNFIGQAHAGSGKTAAYSLAMLTVVDEKKAGCQAMCVCPTRELARQVAEVVEKLGKYTQIKVHQAIAGAARGKVAEQIVVGTPGTLAAKLKFRDIDKNMIQMMVVDEADQLIEGANNQDTETVNLRRSLNAKTQILLFSATFPERVITFSDTVAPRAVWIRVKTEELSLDNILQYFMRCPTEKDKFNILTDIYSFADVGSCIIFVHTVATAKFLAKKMRDGGLTVGVLYGKGMEHAERDRVMDDFRHGRVTTLISTNVLSRGIDVLSVNLVVNYDLPLTKDNTPDFETYIHRIGRTGRFGKPGVAINFIYNELTARQLDAIARHYNKKIEELPWNDQKLFEAKVRAALAAPPTVPLATTTTPAAPGGPPAGTGAGAPAKTSS